MHLADLADPSFLVGGEAGVFVISLQALHDSPCLQIFSYGYMLMADRFSSFLLLPSPPSLSFSLTNIFSMQFKKNVICYAQKEKIRKVKMRTCVLGECVCQSVSLLARV